MTSVARLFCLLHVALLLVSLPISPAFAQGDQSDLQAFNAAYTAYKQHAEAGSFGEAAGYARTAFQAGSRLFGEDSDELPQLAFNYGAMLTRSGDPAGAHDVLSQAAELTERRHGKNSVRLVPILMELGRVADQRFESRVMVRSFDRALKLSARHFGDDSERFGNAARDASTSLLRHAEFRKAEKYLERAHAALKSSLGGRHEAVRQVAYDLASLNFQDRNLTRSESWLSDMLDSYATSPGEMTDLELDARKLLIAVHEETDNSDRATVQCLRIARARDPEAARTPLLLYQDDRGFNPAIALGLAGGGEATVSYTVDARGYVRDPRFVTDNLRGEFGSLLISRVKSFRYAPRVVDGKLLDTENFEYTLRLRGN